MATVSLEEAGARILTSPHVLPRVSRRLNDSYCLSIAQSCLLTGSIYTEQTIDTFCKQPVNLNVVNVVPSAPGHSQKRELSPGLADCQSQKVHKLKYVKGVSCVTQLSYVPNAPNAPSVASNLPVGARLQNFWKTWLDLGGRSESSSDFERGLHPPLSDPTQSHKVSHSRKLLCQSSQEQLPVRSITSAYKQKRRRAGPQPNFSGVFQPTISSSKTQQPVETYSRSEQAESLPQDGEIQNGDTRNHQNIPPARGVGHFHRFQGRLLPYTNTGTIQEIYEISRTGPDIPV